MQNLVVLALFLLGKELGFQGEILGTWRGILFRRGNVGIGAAKKGVETRLRQLCQADEGDVFDWVRGVFG